MIRLDEYNVAIKQKDGTYVTAKNNEVSLDLSTYKGRSANDYIQFLGGDVAIDTNILNEGNISSTPSIGGMSGMSGMGPKKD